ncbi:hypothetical protein G5B39_01500 [Rhodobacteraceae bacterium SC52]|nr:hypothetical protein G5B39_01500 [Rhodobacteraceae bacterium SC52]
MRTPPKGQATRRFVSGDNEEWEEAQTRGGPVAIVVLGFGFLAGFCILSLLFGYSAVASLLIGWAGSLTCVILAVCYGAWREHVAAQLGQSEPAMYSSDDVFTVWDADLSADQQHSATVSKWDDDLIIDAVPVDKRRA